MIPIQQRNDLWAERFELARQHAEKIIKRTAKKDDVIARNIGSGDISTKVGENGGLTLDPTQVLKPYLYPSQLHLLFVCKWLRFFKNILLWEECYYSFWVVLVCFAMSVVFWFVPWCFLTKWTARIVAWGVFGPWIPLYNKIVHYCIDNKYLRRSQVHSFILPEDDALILKKIEEERWEEHMKDIISKARETKETMLQLRSWKMYLFGKCQSSSLEILSVCGETFAFFHCYSLYSASSSDS